MPEAPVQPSPTLNLLDVATQSYRMAGVLKGPGRGLSGSEQQEALHIFNAILDGVKTERWFFYEILRTLFDTIPGQVEYTIGPRSQGSDWDLERPERILGTGVIVPGAPPGITSEIPVYNCLSWTEYKSIITKQSSSSLAQVLYYRAALPLGVATLWPVPDRVYQMVLYTPQTVQEFNDIQGTFIVPKGYREFLEYEGAVKVHDRYPENPLSPNVIAKAAEYKARVEAQQWSPAFMRSDPATLKGYSGYSSWVFNGRTTVT